MPVSEYFIQNTYMSRANSELVTPRYDNSFMLDLTLSAYILLAGSFLFSVYESFIYFMDYENGCSEYTCGIDAIVLASSGVLLLAIFFFVRLSYPEELKRDLALVTEFAVVDSISKRKSFGERFIWGSNWPILMWLFLIALLPIIAIPVWGYKEGDLSTSYFVSYLLIIIFIALLLIFWLVATLPESMIANNGQGSSYFYDLTLSACCGTLHLAPDQDESNGDEYFCCNVYFWKKHTGSDFLVGSWVFFGVSGAALAVSIYYTYLEYQNLLIYIMLVSSLLFFVGTAILVYCSYPGQFFSRFWWCTMTCQSGGGWGGGGERDERRRLV